MISFLGRRSSVAAAAALTAGLVVTLPAIATPAAAAPPPTPAAVAKPAPADPETVASIEARRTGRPVEVDSLGTESTEVLALPDGNFTANVHIGPSRFRDQAGAWRDVDLRLEKRADGSVAPRAHPRGLVLSGAAGAGDHDLAQLSTGPAALALGWSGTLPEPVLDDLTATYPEVRPGIDLVMEVTRTGFEQFLVVKNKEAAPAVKTIAMPWRTSNVTPEATADGGFELRDAQGKYVGHVPGAEMWDASVGKVSGDPLRRAPVAMSVRKDGRSSVLALSPQESFLSNPATKYPVTIDPAPTLKPGFDAFVQNSYNSDQSAAKELKLGYVEEGGTFIARSFLNWGTSAIRGKRVVSATMYLYNHWSYSCDAAKWQVWITGAAGKSTSWDSQPAWGGGDRPVVESTMTKGYGTGNCGDGYVTANVKPTFEWAARNNVSTLTTGIRASKADEDADNQETWKKFSSSEGAKDPYISITYNSKPNVPAEMTIGGKRCEPGQPAVFISRTPYFPNVQAKLTDPDSTERTLKGQFYLAEKGKAYPANPTMTDDATSGTFATKVIPSSFALTENKTYVMVATSTDGLDTSGNSATCEFTVDSVGPAKPPTVTSAEFPECVPAGCDTGGGAGDSGKFTLGANGIVDVKKYRWWFDGGTKVEVAAVASPGVTEVQIAPPLLQNALHLDDFSIGGQRVLHVESVDQAGRSSAEYRNLVQPDEAVGYNMLVGSAPGAIARWKLDDPAGSTSFADSIGSGGPLIVGSTGVTKAAQGSGDGGSAFTFDGSTGNAERGPLAYLNQNLTIGANVRLTAKTTDRIIVQQSRSNGFFAPYIYYTLFFDSGADRWCAQVSTASIVVSTDPKTWLTRKTTCSTTAVQLSVWTSVYATLDGATQKLDLYVNGAKVGLDATAAAPPPPSGTAPKQYFRIGAGGYNVGPFKGEIDDVRVWSRMLHADEVAAASVFESGRWDLNGNGDDTSTASVQRPLSSTAVDEEWWAEAGHIEGDPGSARFEGTRWLETGSAPIRTDQSFTVSSWANLAELPTGNKGVVSLDATNKFGLFLGVRHFSDGPKWTFSMLDADGRNTTDPMVHASAPSPLVDDDTGTWVHLVAVYDAPAQQIRLYVDGQLAKTTARTTRWNATGSLIVGRTRWFNATAGTSYYTDWLQGGADAVRVYSGALSPSLVNRLHTTTDGQL